MSRARHVRRWLFSGARTGAGVVIAYFFDPRLGRERRTRALRSSRSALRNLLERRGAPIPPWLERADERDASAVHFAPARDEHSS